MQPNFIFLLAALRGVLELVFWVLLGRIVLGVLAGEAAKENVVSRIFDRVLQPPRMVVTWGFPRLAPVARDGVTLFLLAVLWFSLGVAKMLVPV